MTQPDFFNYYPFEKFHARRLGSARRLQWFNVTIFKTLSGAETSSRRSCV